MGLIGCLGDIVFEVGPDVVRTAGNIVWSGSARYEEHQRHSHNALTEFAGIDADRFSFDMKLLSRLGAGVMADLVKIWAYEREGRALQLVFGEKGYGKYRWTIRSHSVKLQYFEKGGELSAAEVSLSLLEYLNV